MFEMTNSKKRIVVLNKSDLLTNGGFVQLPDSMMAERQVAVSALYNQGIGELKKAITGGLLPESLPDRLVPNLRQKLCLETARQFAVSAQNGLDGDVPFELIAIDIREAMNALGEITGETIGDDLLDRIFEKFCVGK